MNKSENDIVIDYHTNNKILEERTRNIIDKIKKLGESVDECVEDDDGDNDDSDSGDDVQTSILKKYKFQKCLFLKYLEIKNYIDDENDTVLKVLIELQKELMRNVSIIL